MPFSNDFSKESSSGRWPFPTLCRYWVFIFIPLMLFSVSFSNFAWAQNAPAHLFSGSAASKASQHRSTQRTKSRLVPSSRERSLTLAQDIKLDTVEDVLWNSKTEAQFFAEYRGLSYFVYVRDVVDLEEIDRLGSSSFAERLFMFQTAKTAAHFIVNSSLEPTYRRISKGFKWLRDLTTFHVVQGGHGELGVQGSKTKGKKLLQFRFHASARNGFEPRIRLGENVVLRYDPLHQDALLEFSKGF